MDLDDDVDKDNDGKAYIGFTGSTGDYYACYHMIDNWKFSSALVDLPSTTFDDNRRVVAVGANVNGVDTPQASATVTHVVTQCRSYITCNKRRTFHRLRCFTSCCATAAKAPAPRGWP